MKNSLFVVLLISIGYMGILFLVAVVSNKLFKKNRKIIYNPLVYALSLGVYCTDWTYYGSVGRASTNGIEFLAIYIGPTLIVFSWWFLLRKMINIAERHNINNIADFISFRYGRSKRIGVLVSLLCIMGIIPYIALQLKAISETVVIVAQNRANYQFPFYLDTAFYISILMGILASSFGVHHIGESRKHSGLVGVITFEAIVKVVILMIAGVYILEITHDAGGFFNYLYNNVNSPEVSRLITLSSHENSYGKWFAMIVMSMFAVMFLPRQYHMSVVENGAARHVKSAMYIFPLYLFMMSIFAIPIAIAGKIFLGNNYNADYTILYLLKNEGNQFLALLTYLGGLSAASGMIIVSSVSLANMFVNNIVVNVFIRYFLKISIGRYITFLKRLAILLIIFLSYLYYHLVGETLNLVDLGLTSFAAITQIGPAVILGLFIKRIPKPAIFYGIMAGAIVWFYTIIVPYMANAGVVSKSILYDGPMGISLLKPTALFGLDGLDPWLHMLFWSMLFNLFFTFLFTMLTDQNEEEKETAALCVDSFGFNFLISKEDSSRRLGLVDIEKIVTNFFGIDYARKMVNQFLANIGKNKNELDSSDLEQLVKTAKDAISQAVGPSAADIIISSYIDMSGKADRRVINVFKDLVSLGLGESRDTLIHRITELNLLLEISKQFASTFDLANKLQQTLDMIRTNLRFDLAVLRRKKDDMLETVAYSGDIRSFNMIANIRKINNENTYIGKSIATLSPIYINDIEFSKSSIYFAELKNKGVKSFCHIPLIIDGKPEGVLSFFSKNYKNLFNEDVVRLLESIAQQLAFLINYHNRNEEIIKVKEVSKELEIAKMIQSSLVSIENIGFKGIVVEAAYSPSVYVGGDYYDIIPVDEHTLDIVIADVSGHNVASALIMSQTRSIIRTTVIIQPKITPSCMLSIISKEVFPQISQHDFIITLLYLRFDTKSGEIVYSNAGHYPPIVLRKGDIMELNGGDLLLGVFEEYPYREFKFTLEDDDILILYTDGVIEAENENGEFFGKERFFKILKENIYMEPSKIKNSILTALSEFTKNYIQKDDISLLIIKKQSTLTKIKK